MGLFGTDGIRGVAGEQLTPGLAAQIGRGAAVVLSKRLGVRPRFVIGRDTRVSGQMLEAALVAGITSGGGDVETLGVVPTPAIAALVRERGADSGVVVSASHNPFADNGIKFFNSEGFKLSDDEEAEIEEHVDDHDLRSQTGAGIGRVGGRRRRRRGLRRPAHGGASPSTSAACASRSTAPTAPPTVQRRSDWRAPAPR